MNVCVLIWNLNQPAKQPTVWLTDGQTTWRNKQASKLASERAKGLKNYQTYARIHPPRNQPNNPFTQLLTNQTN